MGMNDKPRLFTKLRSHKINKYIYISIYVHMYITCIYHHVHILVYIRNVSILNYHFVGGVVWNAILVNHFETRSIK